MGRLLIMKTLTIFLPIYIFQSFLLTALFCGQRIFEKGSQRKFFYFLWFKSQKQTRAFTESFPELRRLLPVYVHYFWTLLLILCGRSNRTLILWVSIDGTMKSFVAWHRFLLASLALVALRISGSATGSW